MLDTDKQGFFEDSQDHRRELELLADNVSQRLLLELDTKKLLGSVKTGKAGST